MDNGTVRKGKQSKVVKTSKEGDGEVNTRAMTVAGRGRWSVVSDHAQKHESGSLH